MNNKDLEAILNNVYRWSSDQQFRGYNKHDGLNSPLMKLFLGWGKWPRIIAIQSVMRSPVNIRPLIGVKKTYNPKGLALFTQGSLDLYQTSGNQSYLENAQSTLNTLQKTEKLLKPQL